MDGQTSARGIPSSSNVTLKGGRPSGLPARKRVSQACDRCRHKKDKCDGRKPSCSTCARRHQICSYDRNTKKRGLPEGYVRDLELQSQTLEAYIQDLEFAWTLAVGIDESLDEKIFPDVIKGGSPSTGLPKIWNDDAAVGDLRQRWLETKACRTLRGRHGGLQGIDGKISKPQSNLDDIQEASNESEDELPASTSLKLSQKQAVAREEALLHKNADLPASHPIDISLPDCSEAARPDFRKLDLPSRAWRLLEIYFAHTHSWLPIVEKHDVLRTFHQYQSDQSAGLLSMGSQAVLWSALALADAQYWSLDTPLSTEVSFSVLKTKDLYQHARDLIPAEDGDFDISHIQALLILSLFNMGNDKYQAAWLMTGQAVRIALHLGLEKTAPEPLRGHASTSTSRNKHVLLGCFALDTLLASRLGRPPHLGVRDILSVKAEVQEDGLEEWDPWNDCLGAKKNEYLTFRGPSLILSTFNRFIKFLCIMNEANNEFSVHENTYQHFIEILRKNDPSVTASKNAVELRLNSVDDTSLLPHHFNLRVAYLATSASVHIRQYRSTTQDDARRNILNELSITVKDWLRVIRKYSETFSLSIAPPTFEYYFRIFYESCQILESSMTSLSPANENWKAKFDAQIKDMHHVWPVFTSLDQEMANSITVGHMPNNSVAVRLTQKDGSPRILKPADVTMREEKNIEQFTTDWASNPGLMALTQLDLTSTSTEASEVLYNVGIEGQRNIDTNSANLRSHPFGFVSSIVGESTALGSLQPQSTFLDLTPPIDITLDQDVFFNEFSTVDAMEWSGIYDQSLLNLGFSNAEIMNQEFYEFCEDFKPT